ncbi:MinD-like ATPase involved in chromosome partitioning or flagellar assembly [Desulfohalotomaculum tongense]|uniref:AAA family ATPase n=1 Tax=Desulforadius tongensis TaxID=1216062 RepID=UPI001956A843|nr:P-loop NTPase [Desulforadius tongensis]MBM7854944.1 MinD-like ATPase involved in chromosome partitioning or flagellar assembly [Desulforadius tongensis]
MLCVIAAEDPSADIIKENLQKMPKFKNWQFITVNHSDALLSYSSYRPDVRPDVVVISRFLPGKDHQKLFANLQVQFPVSHIVILAGVVNEATKGYIRMCKKYGLYNIVTGVLPGDRPYTLPVALTYPKEIKEGPIIEEEDTHQESVQQPYQSPVQQPETRVQQYIESQIQPPGISVQQYVEPPHPLMQPVQADRPAARIEQPYQQPAQENQQTVPIQREQLTQPYQQGQPYRQPAEPLNTARYQPSPTQSNVIANTPAKYNGVFAITSANKGGVGKTTACITLGLALSKAGIKTLLWDIAFGGPNLKNFFDIKNVPGIEYLAERYITPQNVRNIIVKVSDNLYVLPGPMNKQIPNFQKGQLVQIADILVREFPVVIGDSSPEFHEKVWLYEIFPLADLILSIVDQSKFSEEETKDYAPKLLMMGVQPEKIKIILNRFSPKLHNPRLIENCYNAGFKDTVPKNKLPRIIATIPEDWEKHVKAVYKGTVVGIDDEKSQWHRVAEELAVIAGQKYDLKKEKKKGRLFSFLKRK